MQFKKPLYIIVLTGLFLTVLPIREARCDGGVAALVKEFTKRAIKAIDLRIQRLQNKTIGLQNIQKELENKLSKLKLNEIGTWVRKQRNLYKKFYDELWKVRKAIADYQRIKEIIEQQKRLIDEYKFTWHMVRLDKHFTKDELSYMYRVYTGIINESVDNLDQLMLIIDSYKLQISDAKRLEMINQVGDNIDRNYADLQQFNDQAVQLSMMRAKDKSEIDAVRKLYGIK